MLPQAATIAPSPLGKGAGLRWRPLPQAEAPTELRVSSGHLAKRSNDRGGSRERQARRQPARADGRGRSTGRGRRGNSADQGSALQGTPGKKDGRPHGVAPTRQSRNAFPSRQSPPRHPPRRARPLALCPRPLALTQKPPQTERLLLCVYIEMYGKSYSSASAFASSMTFWATLAGASS